MEAAHAFRILFYREENDWTDDLPRPMEEGGLSVACRTWPCPVPADWSSYHLVVLAAHGSPEALSWCRRLRHLVGDYFVPLVFLTGDSGPAVRQAGFEAGADACLQKPVSSSELVAQVDALLRIKARYDRLHEKAAAMQHTNKRLQQAHQRVNEELELARHIQQSFLPKTLPEIPGARFAVHYRPCGRVGGDFYDLFRLDEQHVGLYVADAMGHGVPASLLTMFLKRAVQAKEIIHNEYHLVPPHEVLQNLNHDLVDQRLVENAFITMVYALVNCQDGTLRFARAGHPYPVYIPRDGPPEVLVAQGSLLGVFETSFTLGMCQLQAGDKALFYTDGTDAVSFEGHAAGTESLLACVHRHRTLSIMELVDRVAHDVFHQIEQPDDFTLLGVERI